MSNPGGITRVGGVLVTSLAVFVGTVAAVPAPASAHTPGCATKQEVFSLERGWTKGRVHRVLDTRGTRNLRSDGHLYRDYDMCRGGRAIAILGYKWVDGGWRYQGILNNH